MRIRTIRVSYELTFLGDEVSYKREDQWPAVDYTQISIARKRKKGKKQKITAMSRSTQNQCVARPRKTDFVFFREREK